MIKHLSKICGLAAFAVLAASASAEVKLNENLSVEGYATAAARVTEGATENDNIRATNQVKIENLGRLDNSAKIALNGRYDAYTAKVSGLLLNGDQVLYSDGVYGGGHNFGLLDAYVSYTKGEFVVTGGKYLGWLGYESFDSPNNAFISYSSASYSSPYATGAKVEYITKAFSTGVSVRDTQFEDIQNSKFEFFKGDDNFGKELGYEAYFLYTGVEKLKVFFGVGYQQVKVGADGREDRYFNTSDVWVSYDLTSKLTLVAEYAFIEDKVDYSWNVLANYAFTADFSGAVRVTGSEAARSGNDTFGYGVASTYVLHKNFSLKAEVTKTENNSLVAATGSNSDVFSYALQAVLKF